MKTRFLVAAIVQQKTGHYMGDPGRMRQLFEPMFCNNEDEAVGKTYKKINGKYHIFSIEVVKTDDIKSILENVKGEE